MTVDDPCNLLKITTLKIKLPKIEVEEPVMYYWEKSGIYTGTPGFTE
jgi:energy-converting hydrogenase Eha subunit A